MAAKETSKFIGDTVSLSANASDTIKLRTERDCKIINISITSTGRVEINKIEQVEVAIYLSGKIEAENLKNADKVYTLQQPWIWSKGIDLVISLTDISAAANKVYVAVETIPIA